MAQDLQSGIQLKVEGSDASNDIKRLSVSLSDMGETSKKTTASMA